MELFLIKERNNAFGLRMRFFFILCLFCLGNIGRSVAQSSSSVEWTVLVYAQAKNNLSSFALKNFNDLASIGSGLNVNLLVQWFQPNQQGVWRYKIEKGKMVLDVYLPTATDGCKTNDLVDSMRWAVSKYPAQKYCLILWNHGIGIIDPVWGNQLPWSPSNKFAIDPSMIKDNPKICISGITNEDLDFVKESEEVVAQNMQNENEDNFLESMSWLEELNPHRGILFNEQSKTYMNNQSLTSALSEIKTSVLNNKKLDILGMDACLMAMLEVGYQARNYANYMVASQEVELAYGWNYLSFVQGISRERMSSRDVIDLIVSSYQSLYKDKIQFYTQSAFDLSVIDQVKRSVDDVVQSMVGCQRIDKNSLVESIRTARRNCLQFSASSYVDLHSFLSELQRSVATLFDKKFPGNSSVLLLKNNLTEAMKSVERSVISSTSGTYLSRAKGMSIYFPTSYMDASYQYTDFAKDSQWLNFLRGIPYR